ncbi:DUF952 domain-containing protein [Nocardioides rubriscoriae]|uniref:DUF952 domain-containing protein n=1 Tax=Nocardioides rubriscoriae TaxID=642762 RepID=UPI001B87F591|nr:DUF952 domain-containing protein [Nocardioides rubriscoriae]
MRIFHLATLADWEAARASGRYTTSTRGRTLAEEGFIHASRGDQWQGVRERYYADVTEPLVLLVIDTERLTSPVVDEEVPGSDETFPHVYGPIEVDAVVRTIPLDVRAQPEPPQPVAPAAVPPPSLPPSPSSSPSFSRLFLEEMFRNVAVASAVLATVVVTALVGRAVDEQWGPVTGALLGLVGAILVVRRSRRGHRAQG